MPLKGPGTHNNKSDDKNTKKENETPVAKGEEPKVKTYNELSKQEKENVYKMIREQINQVFQPNKFDLAYDEEFYKKFLEEFKSKFVKEEYDPTQILIDMFLALLAFHMRYVYSVTQQLKAYQQAQKKEDNSTKIIS